MNSVCKLYFLFSLYYLSDGSGTKYKILEEYDKRFSPASNFMNSNLNSSSLREDLRKLSEVLISEMIVRKTKVLRTKEVSENSSQLSRTKINRPNLSSRESTAKHTAELGSFHHHNHHLYSSRDLIALLRSFQKRNSSFCQSRYSTRDQLDVVRILCKWIKSSTNYTGSPVSHTDYTARKVKRDAETRSLRSLPTLAQLLNQTAPQGSLRNGMPSKEKIPGFVTKRGGRVLRISMEGKIRGVNLQQVDAFCKCCSMFIHYIPWEKCECFLIPSSLPLSCVRKIELTSM